MLGQAGPFDIPQSQNQLAITTMGYIMAVEVEVVNVVQDHDLDLNLDLTNDLRIS